MSQKFLNERQAAERLGLTPRTLQAYRTRGGGPRYVRLGGPTGRVRYDVAELDAWMARSTFQSTAEEAVTHAG